MKWVLIWVIINPVNSEGNVGWVYSYQPDLTQTQCEEQLAKKHDELLLDALNKSIIGHQIMCRRMNRVTSEGPKSS